jgi:SOS-response transcriptional repressor LexA
VSTDVDILNYPVSMATDAGQKSRFAEWLTAEIKARNWNQSEFGRRAGESSRSTVSSWVTGSRLPEPDSCVRIADALGIDPDEVLDRAGHRKMTPVERQLRDENRKLRNTVVAQQTTISTYADLLDTGEEYDLRVRPITVIGEVAAGGIRLVGDFGMEPVPVFEQQLKGARSPKALLVTGDCMRAVGIHPGDVVVIDLDYERQPNDGELVVISISDGLTFKRWCVVSDMRVELRDGDGTVAATINPLMDDYKIEGVYVTYLPLAPR